MNIRIIQDALESSKNNMLIVLRELESAHQESRFNMFLPLVQRSGTIAGKIEALEHIVQDLKNVRAE